MITKERFIELINQKAKIYGIGKSNNVFCVGLKYRIIDDNFIDRKYEALKNFYENKDDAEWAAKMYTQRPLYFEPPTYKEFLRDSIYGFLSLYNERYCVLINDYDGENDCPRPREDWTVVLHDGYGDYIVEEPLNEENYTVVTELARKIFLEGDV